MTADEQRKYWRDKQRESRVRRSGKKETPQAPPIAAAQRVVIRPYVPPPSPAITANVSCRASMEEIAALGPVRCAAFMNGVAKIISVLNPQRS